MGARGECSADQRQARLDGALLVARTVAHQLNNSLSPIVGFAELLAADTRVASDPRLSAFVRCIQEAARDAGTKVARLQRIVRLEEIEAAPGSGVSVLDLTKSADGAGERTGPD